MNRIHQRLYKPAGQLYGGGADTLPGTGGGGGGGGTGDGNEWRPVGGGRLSAQTLGFLDYGGAPVGTSEANMVQPWQRTVASDAGTEECFDPTAMATRAGADAFYRAHPQCMPEGWQFTTTDSNWWKPWAIGAGVLAGGVLAVSLLARRRRG